MEGKGERLFHHHPNISSISSRFRFFFLSLVSFLIVGLVLALEPPAEGSDGFDGGGTSSGVGAVSGVGGGGDSRSSGGRTSVGNGEGLFERLGPGGDGGGGGGGGELLSMLVGISDANGSIMGETGGTGSGFRCDWGAISLGTLEEGRTESREID